MGSPVITFGPKEGRQGFALVPGSGDGQIDEQGFGLATGNIDPPAVKLDLGRAEQIYLQA